MRGGKLGRIVAAICCGFIVNFGVWVAATGAIWRFFSALPDPANAAAASIVPVLLVLASSMGAFAGSVLALLIAQRYRWIAYAAVVPGVGGAIIDLMTLPDLDPSHFQLLPHPTWMLRAQIVVPVLLAWLAARVVPANASATPG
jgi:hypothetical protein